MCLDEPSLTAADFSSAEDTAEASYPPSDQDRILPLLPQDPVPNPEPEQPSLGTPDPGIYEGTGGTASLDEVPLQRVTGR